MQKISFGQNKKGEYVMNEFKFNAATFEQIQNLIYPLINALFDFNPAEEIGDKSKVFNDVGYAFEQISELFYVAGRSLEDGLLTVEEIEAIISEAIDIPNAIKTILNGIKTETENGE